jgi:hypothetical protein
MLQIRAQQMTAFEQAALRRFEDEMVVHSKEFTPRLCEVLGDEQLRVALRLATARAIGYGFTNRGPIRLFIELMFLCGSAFDTDPQYPAIQKVLNTSGDQMERAEQIYEGLMDYQEKVFGPDAVNVRKALRELSRLAQQPEAFSFDPFETGMLQEMGRAFPQKAAYVGEAGLRALIHEGRAEARKYRFPLVRAEGLVVVLMFAFGHGCTDDPLYPWISRTLMDEKIIDPAARAKRLEKKALTWLDHVLSRPREATEI